MHIIKVDAIDSTNTFLRDLNREKHFTTPVCVIARKQLLGKGQMGTIWQSNPGENLTCSVFMPIERLPLTDQFYVSIATSLAVCDTLNRLMVPKLSIKWPNDILSDRQKLCGILIENVVKNGSMIGAIIGIGININQIEFDNLPQAGSLKQVLGQNLNIEEVLQSLLVQLEKRFSELCVSNFVNLKKEYEAVLFRKNKPSTFLDVEGESFVGIIKTITNEGKLQVLIEDEIISDFDLKEIKLLY
ncbi:BirA family biotin operon repressor/biotin-[acetyl-CoA-carboxylase] ligase [Aquimarina sp. EL_43]|uniref:biotin--[acetyl-CoA-carboxylase] ligase n=1 Tax=Aquimarina TaxID=290174 RepID=UPI00046EA015|nr:MULTISPECIES: biotin--[acetyl-CoA-carboxylase] ligase [Aquimarina]MBG6130914.1 BirA family biotin operon repressor/biotin-[acetyl-CoA-carboxylase] ligase [Aquimarina sp. EL_35]MBG6151373.1 BirA family biotin operon repressor/biotin-[acetyl-CoA-carboxylase] ligase [Aquimarina sp. EL_32]MBG6169304.1 BirA family biotin operon repressor/biotin-[acetyl-CoA-carboxylase] ligase [Aquimarina sp. EL_43]